MKFWLKECPKCHGDLREESNTFGTYIACMQCGYSLKQSEEVQLLMHGTLKGLPVPAPRELLGVPTKRPIGG
jgi:hypothetical protein